MTDTYRTVQLLIVVYLFYLLEFVTIVGEGYLTTTSEQIFAYGDSGWKLIPFLIASPHLRSLTNSKSRRALSASAFCLSISTFALALHSSIRPPSKGIFTPAEMPKFPLRDVNVSGSSLLLLLPRANGETLKVAPWQLTPAP